MKYEYIVNTKKQLPYWLGDTFYKLDKPRSWNNVLYEATCPCCQGKTKITAKGMDGEEYFVDCPVCVEGRRPNSSITSYIMLNNYEVNEYHVYEVNLSNRQVVSSIKPNYASFVTFHAFCKTSSGDYFTARITEDTLNMVDRNLDDLAATIESIKERNTSDYIFSDKEDAEKFLQIVKDYNKKRLEEFNSKYNTSYEYPY